MIFRISWAADPRRSGTVWFRSGMVPSCHMNYQKFGEFMFGRIITKKLIFTSHFSSVLFRHTWSRETFDTWFHNLGPPFIETTGVGGPRNPKSLNLPYCNPLYRVNQVLKALIWDCKWSWKSQHEQKLCTTKGSPNKITQIYRHYWAVLPVHP